MIFRDYLSSDKHAIARLMNELQQHIVALDSLHRNICHADYGEKYATELLERVTKEKGFILVADSDNEVVACAVVVPEAQSATDLLSEIPVREARIIELIVSEHVRSKGIGSQMMHHIEDRLRQEGYHSIRVAVFQPNAGARRFYEQCGYSDRMIDMLKIV